MLASQYTDFAAALAAPKRFTTALYFGPGLVALVQALSCLHAENLVAFTTPITKKGLLRLKENEFLQSNIHQTLVSTGAGNATLHEFNIRDYASLRSATGLKQIFPGLRETRQTTMDAIAPKRALEEAGLEGTNNLLILGAMGFEMEVLNAVLAADRPHIFSRIILILPAMALYSGSSDGETLTLQLERASYRRTWTDTSDPDMPIAAFDLDHGRLNDRSLLKKRDQEISVLNGRLDHITADIDERQKQFENIQNRLKEAEKERDTAKTEATTKSNELIELSARMRNQVQERTELIKDLEQSAERQKSFAAELENRQTTLASTEKEKEKTSQELSKTLIQNDELQKQVETLKAEHKKATKEAARQLEMQQGILANLRSEYDASQAQCSKLGTTLTSTETEKEKTSQELSRTLIQNDELKKQIETLKVEHNKATKEAARQLEMQQGILANLRSEYNASQVQCSKLGTTLASTETEKEKTSQELSKTLTQNDELKKQVETLKAEHNKATKEATRHLEMQHGILANLRSEYDASQAQCSKLGTALASTETEKEAALYELSQAWAKTAELEELFENLRNEHSRAQNKNIEIISQITRAKEKGEDDLALALRLQMLREADVAELMNRYRSLKGENEHLINLLRKVLHNLSFLQASKQNSRKASKRL